jgi:hypothetical protein
MNAFDFSPEELDRLRRENETAPPPNAGSGPPTEAMRRSAEPATVRVTFAGLVSTVLILGCFLGVVTFFVFALVRQPGLVLLGLGLATVLIVGAVIREAWSWLEYRAKHDLRRRGRYLAAIVAAAVIAFTALAINAFRPRLLPPVVVGFVAGAGSATIGLTILWAGLSLVVQDLRAGVTSRIGPWSGRTTEVPGYSYADRFRVIPCLRTEEPREFALQIVKILAATTTAAAVFIVPCGWALLFW